MEDLLEIKDLSIDAKIGNSYYNIVNNVSIKVKKGEIVSIVGESGSGKTITSLSIIRLLEKNLSIKKGEIIFEGKNLTKLSEEEIRKIRGKEISFVFQEPLTALNPVIDIETQIAEVLIKHQISDEKKAIEKTIKILERVGIPTEKSKQYPHNFSGGQRQRILIAMALIANPKLIIADEPTTALDVITQIEILNLLKEIKEEKRSIILITHNISVVANYSDYIYVMYLGEIMESGKTNEIINNPIHPYTKLLLNSIITLEKKERLKTIEGQIPSIYEIPKGCRFITRCPYKTDKCTKEPPLIKHKERYFRCWNV
jgi:oligopeptide/dipeptide ABC transporter ATP-binding protein